jgi:nitrile hydratase subunit beta
MTASALRNHIYNMDEQRHAIERMEPRHYVAAAYFERHLTALAKHSRCRLDCNLRLD